MDSNEHLSVDHDHGPVEYTLQRTGTRDRSVHVIWLKVEAISSSGMFVFGALATGRGYLSAEE
jgi:hypothetical protein